MKAETKTTEAERYRSLALFRYPKNDSHYTFLLVNPLIQKTLDKRHPLPRQGISSIKDKDFRLYPPEIPSFEGMTRFSDYFNFPE